MPHIDREKRNGKECGVWSMKEWHELLPFGLAAQMASWPVHRHQIPVEHLLDLGVSYEKLLQL